MKKSKQIEKAKDLHIKLDALAKESLAKENESNLQDIINSDKKIMRIKAELNTEIEINKKLIQKQNYITDRYRRMTIANSYVNLSILVAESFSKKNKNEKIK